MLSRVTPPAPKTYAQLRDAVIAVVIHGRREIDRAWLQTYHETGRLINEHILQFRDRADYGARVYDKLATDTAINKRTLQACAQFQRYFPIANTCSQLDWSKCRLLCQVTDAAQREDLRAQVLKKHWTVLELETRVRGINALALAAGESKPAAPVELLAPRRGTPGLHLVVGRGDALGIDLGFKSYLDLTPEQQRRLAKGDIVRLAESGIRKAEEATKADLFTYRATIRKVIDGDTLDIAIVLAPGFTRDLKLRLRGIDCPEMATAAGRAAKAFVEKLLHVGDEVIVCTTKPDKYDRYLADVFVGQASGTPDLFLNNALLDSGHAIPYDGGAKEE